MPNGQFETRIFKMMYEDLVREFDQQRLIRGELTLCYNAMREERKRQRGYTAKNRCGCDYENLSKAPIL